MVSLYDLIGANMDWEDIVYLSEELLGEAKGIKKYASKLASNSDEFEYDKSVESDLSNILDDAEELKNILSKIWYKN